MQQGIGPSVKDPNLTVETVVSGLDLPTSMDFLGPDDFLVLNNIWELYDAYGIKNIFGLAFDPLTGNLWDTEPGRLKNDEINIVNPGFNGGFGVMQGLATLVPAAQSALVDFGGKGKYLSTAQGSF